MFVRYLISSFYATIIYLLQTDVSGGLCLYAVGRVLMFDHELQFQTLRPNDFSVSVFKSQITPVT